MKKNALFVLVMFLDSAGYAAQVYKGSAVLVVKEKYVPAFKQEVLKIIAPTLKESGNISYEAFQVLDKNGKSTNRFEFHELWKSEHAMMVEHKENSQHMKNFFSKIKVETPESWIESFSVSGSTVERLGQVGK